MQNRFNILAVAFRYVTKKVVVTTAPISASQVLDLSARTTSFTQGRQPLSPPLPLGAATTTSAFITSV
jgi:hypothetical protein